MLVHVGVGMLDCLVGVAMAMRFAEEAPDADGHQRGGEAETGRDGLGEHANGCNCPDERGDCEVRACAWRAAAAQWNDVESEARTVRKRADDARGDDRARCGPRGTKPQRRPDVDRAADEPLQRCNRHDVVVRDFAREIVVERPARAREGHGRETERVDRSIPVGWS